MLLDMQTQLIVNKSYRLELLDTDVIACYVYGVIDRIKAIQLVEEYNRMADRKPVKIIFCFTSLRYIESDAQEFLASESSEKYLKAGAVVQGRSSVLLRTLINSYLKLRTGPASFRIFDSKESALEWLERI